MNINKSWRIMKILEHIHQLKMDSQRIREKSHIQNTTVIRKENKA